MCQSKANGGRRCGDASAFAASRTSLVRRARYHTEKGHESRVEELQAAQAHLTHAHRLWGDHVTYYPNFNLPQPVFQFLEGFRDDGLTPLIVGGSVRDSILHSDSKDIDVEVYGGDYGAVAASLRQRGYIVNEVGRAFGVLKTRLADGDELDISIPRTDNHTGSGHRGFTVDTSQPLTVEEASSRRDFTINAVAYSHRHHVLIDPHGGVKDMEAGMLRHVSGAFSEDPLRSWRGFQFAARFNMDLHPETADVCRNMLSEAPHLAEERVREEWMKFYHKAVSPSRGLAALHDTEWDRTLPGLRDANSVSLREEVDLLTGKPRLLAAAIVRRLPEGQQRAFLNATVVGNREQRAIYHLANTPAPTSLAEARSTARDLATHRATVEEVLTFAELTDQGHTPGLLEDVREAGVATGPEPSWVDGRELMTLHADRRPGPWLGEMVTRANALQDSRTARDRTHLLALLSED